LVDRTPVARRVIRLDVDYTVGASVSAQVILPEGNEAKQQAMQESLDRWASTCRIGARFWQDLFRRLLTDGEIGVKFVPAPGGYQRPVVFATVAMKTEVDKDSGDVVALVATVDGKPRRFTVTNSLTEDPVTGGEPILYFRHDASGADEDRVRGIPELVPLVTRLQYEDEIAKLEVNRAKSMLRYFWQVIVKGASREELEELQKKYAQAPATGTVRYTNDLTEFKGISPDLQSYETSRVLQDVRISIASGAGVPVHFLGEGGDANLATATAMGSPTFRQMERLQGEFSDMASDILKAALASLGFDVSPDLVFDFTLPEIDAEDDEVASRTLVQTVAAVDTMVGGGYISHDAGQRILSSMIEQSFGIELSDEDLPDEEPDDPYLTNPPPVPPEQGEEGEEAPPEE
jgi:hypothetical protein